MIDGEIEKLSRTKSRKGEFPSTTASRRSDKLIFLFDFESEIADRIDSGSNENDCAPKEGGPGKEMTMRELGLLVRGQAIRGRRVESNTRIE